MKLSKLSKLVLVSAMAFGMIGCASVGSVANKMVNNKSEGIIYGAAGISHDSTVINHCKLINNRDYRCEKPNDYVLVYVMSKFGFADGAVGIGALVKKDFPNLNVLKHSMVTGDKNLPYVKAKVVAGQLGEVLEIMPAGTCKWGGMPRIGGTVCEGLYDYQKDYLGVVYK